MKQNNNLALLVTVALIVAVAFNMSVSNQAQTVGHEGVETLEKFFVDYNNMDGEAVAGYFADEWTFRAATGGTFQRTNEDMKSAFDNYSSVQWTPLKIYDIDPKSGVTVYSTEKRVMKDGTVWEKDLVELFFFDLEGKISSVEQYAREISGE
jgi:ketosteroid isomerase-like protein